MIDKTASFGILAATSSFAVALLIISMTTPSPQFLKPVLAQDVSSMVKDAMIQLNETRMALQEQNNSAAMTHLNQIENDLMALTLNGTTSTIPAENQSSMVNDKNLPTNTIQLNAQEKKGVYTWSNKQGTNPVLTFKIDANNLVHIKNPTDEKHELIITSAGSEVASSGDVNPVSKGQLSFSPTTTTGTFQYHCQYHPDTMKGTIKLISP